MKKQNLKKLVLAKETMRNLSRADVSKAAGGTFVTWTCWSSPEYSCQDEIPTGAQPTCAG
jgi:hypothetical protein